MPLLWYLRDELGLTGTKFGCGAGLCGACTVHRDGQAIRACQTPMSTLAGKQIVTIEGLSADGSHPVQEGLGDGERPAVRILSVGQIMQAAALLKSNRAPPMRPSTRQWRATCAVAVRISAFARRFKAAAEGGRA
jgi:isoquinoline 1-oxidoreductase alpha subunit